MSRKLIAVLAVVLAACQEKLPPDVKLAESRNAPAPVASQEQGRISVTRIGVFRDELAYYDKRGIYVIRDAETGGEYIGISGIGITEVAKHGCGKACTKEDER